MERPLVKAVSDVAKEILDAAVLLRYYLDEMIESERRIQVLIDKQPAARN